MGVTYIPYNPESDPLTHIGRATSNIGQVLMRRAQQRDQARDIQRLAKTLPDNHPLKKVLMNQQMQSPFGQQAAMQGIAGAFQPTPTNLRTIGTGEVTSIFNPRTGQITPTEHPSSRVPSTSVNIKPPPAKMMEDMSQLYEFEGLLGDISSLFESGGKEVVGPIAGRYQEFAEKWGSPFGEGPTEDQVIFTQIVNTVKENLARLRSGGQITASEFVRLDKLVPDPKTPKKVFKSKIKGLELATKRAVEGKQRILRETGYMVPGEVQQPLGLQQSGLISGKVRITSDSDYDSLPSGTVFIGPDGNERTKP